MTMRVHIQYYSHGSPKMETTGIKKQKQNLKSRLKVICLKSHKGDRGLDKESIMPDCPTKISKRNLIKEPQR